MCAPNSASGSTDRSNTWLIAHMKAVINAQLFMYDNNIKYSRLDSRTDVRTAYSNIFRFVSTLLRLSKPWIFIKVTYMKNRGLKSAFV